MHAFGLALFVVVRLGVLDADKRRWLGDDADLHGFGRSSKGVEQWLFVDDFIFNLDYLLFLNWYINQILVEQIS